jgi:hypothetical protein
MIVDEALRPLLIERPPGDPPLGFRLRRHRARGVAAVRWRLVEPTQLPTWWGRWHRRLDRSRLGNRCGLHRGRDRGRCRSAGQLGGASRPGRDQHRRRCLSVTTSDETAPGPRTATSTSPTGVEFCDVASRSGQPVRRIEQLRDLGPIGVDIEIDADPSRRPERGGPQRTAAYEKTFLVKNAGRTCDTFSWVWAARPPIV